METVNLLFRGLLVPAGEHAVTFAFESDGVRNGRFISLTALILWLFMLFITLFILRKKIIIQRTTKGR